MSSHTFFSSLIMLFSQQSLPFSEEVYFLTNLSEYQCFSNDMQWFCLLIFRCCPPSNKKHTQLISS